MIVPDVPMFLRGRGAVFLEGTLESEPMDMPSRQEDLVKRLRADGYEVLISSYLRGQPIRVWLFRKDEAVDPEAAESRFRAHLDALNVDYSLIERYVDRFVAEVVAPTLEGTGGTLVMVGKIAPWAIGAFVIAQVVNLLRGK